MFEDYIALRTCMSHPVNALESQVLNPDLDDITSKLISTQVEHSIAFTLQDYCARVILRVVLK